MKYFIHELEQAQSVEISPWFKYMYNILNAIHIYFVQSHIELIHNVYKPAI